MKTYECKKTRKIVESVLLLTLCAALSAGVWAQGRAAKLSDGLVRLHVLAVSDDEYEQAVKLQVRDAVLAYLTPGLEGLSSPDEAREYISGHLDGIASAAESASEGRPVSVSMTREYYPTRDYGSFALPAGEYTSLRIVLGEGLGHNWWCVVFPPLCMAAAEPAATQTAGLDENDAALISGNDGQYEIRFRTLELWGELKHALDRTDK